MKSCLSVPKKEKPFGKEREDVVNRWKTLFSAVW